MILLDTHADTFPVGLAGTPFEEVYRALRIVAADAWSIDPLAYRAGMAWGFYALQEPAALSSFRDVVVAALISAMAPMVKESQTDSELVEYLRQWREYTPTFPKLQNLYKLFGADVDIEPISDPESQAVLPVEDTRLAFYVRIESIDFPRPLSLAEAYEIALRATPMGSRPFPYYAIGSAVDVPVATATPLEAVTYIDNWEPAVEPIPPTPSLPTVSFPEELGCGTVTISSGSSTGILKTWGAGSWSGSKMPWDGGKTYSSTIYAPGDGNRYNSCGVFEPVDVTGYVGAKNVSNASKAFRYIVVATCSDSTATVITVYDSSNVAYNAFKYTADTDNTDYYYVLDGVQTDWVSDLSSIGYSETPALPTVSFPEELGCDTVTISSGSSTGILKTWGAGSWSGSKMPWDGGKTYSSTIYAPGDGNRYNSCGVFEPVDVTGYVGAKNVSNASKAFRYIVVATCSDSTATVITVYDSSNVAYNAFKYTADTDNTDYYYVLDGVQTDWVSDLSSIGYSETPAPSNFIDVVFAFYWSNNAWTPVNFNYASASNWWYTCIMSDFDKLRLEQFGLSTMQGGSYLGGYGTIPYAVVTQGYSFEILETYSDAAQTPSSLYDLSKFRFVGKTASGMSQQAVCIESTVQNSAYITTFKCRITRNS